MQSGFRTKISDSVTFKLFNRLKIIPNKPAYYDFGIGLNINIMQ